MTEFRYDLKRGGRPHRKKIMQALETAKAGDTIHMLSTLSNGSVLHTYYTVRARGGGRLVARFDRDVVTEAETPS